MQQKRLLSILFLAAAWVAFNATPIWAQAQPGETKGTGAGQTQDKSIGGTQSKRLPDSGVPSAPGAGQAQTTKEQDKSVSGTPGRGAEDVKQAQEALKNAGHDPGPIDGIMGPQTRQALKAFQGSQGLKETGSLDAETSKKLKIEKGAAASGAPSSERGKSPGGSPSAERQPGAGTSKSPEQPSAPMGK